MLLRLIDDTSLMKVDIGLKMLIEPIYFWLVASQCYKKPLSSFHINVFLLFLE